MGKRDETTGFLHKHLNSKTPGPRYDIPSSIGSSPKKSMASKLRTKNETEAPGVGTYDPEKNKNYNLQYSMGARLESVDKMAKLIPGPGNYTNQSARSGRSFGFGSSMKISGPIGEATRTPAPGAYDAHSKISKPSVPVFGFGTVEREIKLKKSELPGPGNY